MKRAGLFRVTATIPGRPDIQWVVINPTKPQATMVLLTASGAITDRYRGEIPVEYCGNFSSPYELAKLIRRP
jgi:hypothetical protein